MCTCPFTTILSTQCIFFIDASKRIIKDFIDIVRVLFDVVYYTLRVCAGANSVGRYSSRVCADANNVGRNSIRVRADVQNIIRDVVRVCFDARH